MRWVAVVLCASACGRLDFDAARDAPFSANDGRISDGTPAATYTATVLADGPIAYFHFDESAGDVLTSTIGGISAPYEGMFAYRVPGAMSGSSAVTFDGASTRIDLGDRFEFAGKLPYTFEMWVRPTALGSTRFVVDRRTIASPSDGYAIYLGTGFFLAGRTAADVEGDYVSWQMPTTGSWIYIVVAYDGAVPRLYVNATLVHENLGANTTIGGGAGHFTIGDIEPPQFFKYEGDMDELAIYDHALTATAIATHFAAAR